MKKFLILILIIVGCQRMPIQKTDRNIPVTFQQVNVGVSANDHTGDPLRTAFQKQNLNWTTAEGLFGNIYSETETETLINDSLIQLRTDALPLGSWVPMWTDTLSGGLIATKTDLLNIEGGGTAGKFYVLSGNVDGSGFPDAGDTSLTHTNFVGKHLTVIREGQVQQQHADNTEQDGFWFDNATGIVRFRPAFGAGEQLEIWATNTIQWETLTAEGGGGEAENALLTDIVSSWMLNEVSGTAFTDQVAGNNGGSTAEIGSIGKFGISRHYTAATHYASVAYNASLALTGDVFTVSLWVRFDQLPSVTGRSAYLYSSQRTDGEYWSNLLYVNSSDQLRFYQKNTGPVPYLATSVTSAFVVDTWYNIIAIVDGDGNNLKLLINGVDAANTTQAFAGTLYGFDSGIIIGGDGVNGAIAGYVDDVNVWLKSLTAPEILDLQTKPYPFN